MKKKSFSYMEGSKCPSCNWPSAVRYGSSRGSAVCADCFAETQYGTKRTKKMKRL